MSNCTIRTGGSSLRQITSDETMAGEGGVTGHSSTSLSYLSYFRHLSTIGTVRSLVRDIHYVNIVRDLGP